MRQVSAPRQRSPARIKAFPAPSGGLIANQNLAAPDARSPSGQRIAGASRLENWFPTATGVRMRGGSQKYATVGAPTAITRLFRFGEGANTKLFASTASAIYDITTVADAAVSPAAAISGQTGGNWSCIQFATSAGVFLRLCNGTDTPQVYDGAAWATTPAITGIGSPASLSFVWAFKNRLFFVQSGTLSAWYLPVDSIGGAVTEFPLGGVFKRGGSLLFGGTWSIDSGFGPSEHCVFVSSEGEFAIYAGSDPSGGISTWNLVGVYFCGKPMGADGHMKAGGELLVLTDLGVIPLSVAMQRDIAALSPSALSYAIEDEWNRAVAERSAVAWQCEVWPTKQMAVVALPTVSTADPRWFVANARTGAWAAYTGWNATCVRVFRDRMFYGTSLGTVVECEVTGADQGTPYTASAVMMFDLLKAPASLKTASLASATYLAPARQNERLSVQKDYKIRLPAAPDAAIVVAETVWGTGTWGSSVWGTPREAETWMRWRSVSAEGQALAPAIQITSGASPAPEVELVLMNLAFDIGGAVTT